MLEAYEDKERGGFNYNNFMLQRWVDHEEVEHRVKDDYERNRTLIDLTQQPDDIKEACINTVTEAKHSEPTTNVGIHFMKFCNKWNLQRLSQTPTEFGEIFSKQIT